MNVIAIGARKFCGPAGWDELTARQFVQLLNWRVKMGSDPAGRFVLLQLWYGIRYRHVRALSDDDRVDLLAVLDFIETLPERWMLPELTVNTRRWIGPGDGLANLTFGEFLRAQPARERLAETGGHKELVKLATALYRPRALFFQKRGDAHRQLFDQKDFESQCAQLSGLPESVLAGIVMNYDGCLAKFPEQYKNLYSGTKSGSGGSWLDVGLSLARQTASLGNFYDLERSDLFLVLTTLDALIKENVELKAKLEANG